jgi:hypothetical protein
VGHAHSKRAAMSWGVSEARTWSSKLDPWLVKMGAPAAPSSAGRPAAIDRTFGSG